MHPTDAPMPDRATDDTRTHFAALLEQHRGLVLKVAASYAHGIDDRADLVQEIAAQAWHAYPRFDDSRRFSTWLYRVALNTAISFARSDGPQRRRTVPLDTTLAEQHVDPGDAETQLRRATLERVMAQLPAFDRALLLLYLDDTSARDIADILGLSQSNVTTRIDRLKQRLRRLLDAPPTGDTDGHR